MRRWIVTKIRKYFLARYEQCQEYADYMKAYYPFRESFGYNKGELASEMAQAWLALAEAFVE